MNEAQTTSAAGAPTLEAAEAARPEGGENAWEVLFPATGAAAPAPALPARFDGVLVGRLVGCDATGQPLVDYAGNAGGPVSARAAVAWGEGDVGREAVLMFEAGDPCR